jgi:predicted hydrocarbon binding protein
MTQANSEARDLTLPASTLRHLRLAIQKEAGPLGATHALHDAGYAAGEAFYEAFRVEVGGDPAALAEGRFWKELDTFFKVRGWGRISQERVHPAFGVLRAGQWGESDPRSGEMQPGCAFSAGVFAYILGRVAGGPIAVLEVECRSRGNEGCSFLVGSEEAIHRIYGHLFDGEPLDAALALL